MNNVFRIQWLVIFLGISLLGAGCATVKPKGDAMGVASAATSPSDGKVSSKNDRDETRPKIPPTGIREFVLSAGDEIAVNVFDHDDLSRRFIIPPDGRYFFPLVGDVDLQGISLRKLQETLTEGLSRYKETTLVPGDEIAITVFKNDDLTRKLVIPPDGKFFYPLVGEVEAGGKTVAEVREAVTTGLKDDLVDPQVSIDLVHPNKTKVVVNPQVSLEVIRLSGQKVYVLGEVNRPGVFPMENGTSVVDAVSLAGGFTLDAKQGNVLVIRGGMEKPKIMEVDMDGFLKDADIKENIPLQRGDIVYVPASTIASVDRFFRHLASIINPIVNLETGIVLEPRVEDTLKGKANNSGTTVIVPPR